MVINMSAVKERILGAVTIMNEDDAQKLWNIITQTFGSGWGNIEEVMPDSWDMQMISEMKADPKCREFVSEKDVLTTHVVNYKNRIIIIKNVPCEECEQYGEKYYSDEVAKRLEFLVNMAKQLMQEISVIDYSKEA